MAKTYYVAGNGNDQNDGLTSKSPFRNIQAAANLTQPGDTVYVMNGTYTNANTFDNIVTITRSGTPDAWITYKAYTGHHPKLVSHNWHGFCVQGASYITIDGFELEGNNSQVTLQQAIAQQRDLNNPLTSGNGIGINPSLEKTPVNPHHVVVRNNTVYGFGGGGIYSLHADYVTIENNTVHDNALYAPYGCSGISLFQNWNSDSTSGYKMFVRNNVVYNNENRIPFYMMGRITDGNGIIIDDSKNTLLSSALGRYSGRTLITGNTVYSNGGRGIHAYKSEHVDIANNVTYKNSFRPEIADEEISSEESSDVRLLTQGTAETDLLTGTNLNDILDGKYGDDTLLGKSGDDILVGGDGKDRLAGDDGADWLTGHAGIDSLTGGTGRDVFALTLGTGKDIIQDFQRFQDQLQLPLKTTLKDLKLSSTKQGTLVSAKGMELALLAGVRVSRLIAADVITSSSLPSYSFS